MVCWSLGSKRSAVCHRDAVKTDARGNRVRGGLSRQLGRGCDACFLCFQFCFSFPSCLSALHLPCLPYLPAPVQRPRGDAQASAEQAAILGARDEATERNDLNFVVLQVGENELDLPS